MEFLNEKKNEIDNPNPPSDKHTVDLSKVTNRKELQDFARAKGFVVIDGKIPLDFYKREVNLVDYARAIGYVYSNKTSAMSAASFSRQKWFYMEKHAMKFPEMERPENSNSEILIGRRSEGPNSKNFKYNEHYYFSQELTHTGEKKNHGSIIDLTQLHFKADLKNSIRIIENFIYKNNQLKENALPFHLKATPVDEASKIKRLESYHAITPLADTSFLNKRGINTDTIKHPFFKDAAFNSLSENGKHLNTAFPIYSENGLIGFEIRNEQFKSIQDSKNDGLWRSNVDHSRKIESLVICESAIDSMSKHELNTRETGKHNLDTNQNVYLSTSGNITGKQIELLQKMVDMGLSRKMELLKNVPADAYKNIERITNQVDESGRVVKDDKGEPVQVARLFFNKPQRLVVAFDNEPGGQLLAAKLLGKLEVSKYFQVKDENCPLKTSQVSPYKNDKTNTGRVTWEINGKSPGEANLGAEKIIAHFKSLNNSFKDKTCEGEPFKLKISACEKSLRTTVDIEFKNLNKNWNLSVDAIKELKFQNSSGLKIDRSVLKDWNEDLQAVKSINPVLEKKYEIFKTVNDHENGVGKSNEKIMQGKDAGDDLMREISRMMDRPKGMKL